MNPPVQAPRSASRSRGRRKGYSGKKPKRLIKLSPNTRMVKENTRSHAANGVVSLEAGSKGLLSPPPFSLSFNSGTQDELFCYMDQLEGAACSTPLALPQQRSTNGSAASTSLFSVSNLSEFQPSPAVTGPRLGCNKSSFLVTPSKDIADNLMLAKWGIPEKVLEQYASKGICSMFEWQGECLSLPGVLSGGNLVYSAPTSAGKTLVAELLALKCVLEQRKKVVVILPFVSIAQEKSGYLQCMFEPVGIKVGGFMGGHSPPGGFAATDIAVCTIEKANSLVNRLLEEKATHQLGLVVVDELHMIGDPHRGYLLELLLTKLMFVSKKPTKLSNDGCTEAQESVVSTAIQLVGMSATLPNLDTLANWLGAELYHTDFRPVPLQEMVKIGSELYDANFKKLREVDESNVLPGDEDGILSVCRERISQGHSVLIFCPTKAWCENLSSTLAGAHAMLTGEEGGAFLDKTRLLEISEQLKRTQVGLDQVLGRTVPHGVAFHHAGLTFEEREIIEGAFRACLIKVLVATSTLSSGVNLPARLVIVRTPFFQRSILDVLVYKQMVGRAGRKGVDEAGESILICKPNDRSKVVGLLNSAPKPVQSCLNGTAKSSDLSAIKRAILEIIASGTAQDSREIETYISCTLLFAELKAKAIPDHDSPASTEALLQCTVAFLVENEFIAVRTDGSKKDGSVEEDRIKPEEYYATQLGMATVSSALSPDEALVVFSEFRKARRNFVLENELHILYLITPVYIQNQWPNIDWYKYLCLWERLPETIKHVAETLGVRESFLARAIQGRISERTPAQKEALRIHRRFFTALALHDLVHEAPITMVGRRYGASKGLLQSLQTAAGTFAGMVTVFCNRLGWKNLELLLSQFQNRLTFGVERELCDLVKISLLNGFRARVLYNSGFHTLAALATANPAVIESCLRNAVPFQSSKPREGDHGISEGARRGTTWSAKLRRGMTEGEAAAAIVNEARRILSQELNVPFTNWMVMQSTAATAGHTEGGEGEDRKGATVVSMRGHRKSLSLATHTVKKPCLQESEPQVRKTSGTHNSGSMVPSSSTPAPQVTHSTKECVIKDLPFASFKPASALLKEEDHQQAKPVALTEQNTHQKQLEALNISPIRYAEVLTKSSSTPALPAALKPERKVDAGLTTEGRLLSQSLLGTSMEQDPPPFTIPDSLPGSINMSMSFSFQTFELIDAACNEVASTTPPNTKECGEPPQCVSEVMEYASEVNRVEESPPNAVGSGPHPSTSKTTDRGAQHTPTTAATPVRSKTTGKSFTVPESPASLSQPNLKELSSLCSSQLSQSGVTVIEVTSNPALFETFVSECVEQSAVAFSLASTNTEQSKGIGSTILQPKQAAGITLPPPHQNEQVVGIAFCWGGVDVYYVSLTLSCSSGDAGNTTIPLQTRVAAVKEIFSNIACREKLIAYDIKKHAKMLVLSCGVLPNGRSLDPSVASWMLSPDAKEMTIHRMVLQYLPEQPTVSDDENYEDMSLSNLATHASEPKMRASAECALSSLLMLKLEHLLQTENLYKPFIDIEMPSVLTLAKLELNGIGFSPEECHRLKDILKARINELENTAYVLAHRTFSLTSPEDVAQVLFLELQLPSGSDTKQQKTLGTTTCRRATKKRVQHLSTAKDVLERIKSLHPLPGVVLEWRRVTSTITKIVYPLFKEAVSHDCLGSVRIHPSCQFHTATGRVSISDPNLQMVPKDFDIGTNVAGRLSFKSSIAQDLLSESQCFKTANQDSFSSTETSPSSVCMRNVFIPFPGGVFVAADYSQLELRILAHLSGDEKLKRVLNDKGDVFKMIAGNWLGLPPSDVSDKQRQEAKQICYGMVYGIGSKALAEQLGLDSEDAAQFMESFKSKYPTMRKFLSDTVKACKERGWVSTISGRKRFLPGIHSTNIHARSQAERQAINSTIQGSAADLVKTAMVAIDRQLSQLFPASAPSLMSCDGSGSVPCSGGYLVLQLHDELMYEVAEKDLQTVAKIIKTEMENALQLSVVFPVKLKTGYSWGTLEPYSTD